MVNQAPRTGNMVNSEAEVENVVDLLTSVAESVSPIPYNEQAAQNILNRTPAVTGNMVGSDKKVYNIVDLLKSLVQGGYVLKYKGSVATYEDLPNDAHVGDVYNVLSNGKNYAWTGTEWDDFGGTVTVALSACTDVDITTPTEGQILIYDSTEGKWKNADQSATYHTFNPNWTTDSTTAAFLQDVYADTSAVPGMAYLGELTCSDLPTGLNNVEAVVEIMPSNVSTKAIHVILTSGNLAPYRWELTYWVVGSTENTSGWIGFQPALTAGKNITITNGTITAADLSELSDVTLTSLSDGDSLIWDETSQKWVNKSQSEVQNSTLTI